MKKPNVSKSAANVIIAVMLALLSPVIGIDQFLDLPLIFLWWFIICFCINAAGHLVSLIVTLITGRESLRLMQLLSAAVILLGVFLWSVHESHGFPGKIGQAVIDCMFTLPAGAVFLFRLITMIVHAVRSRQAVPEKERSDAA